ncbi:N-acetyltransferase family protein [Streptomyces sp. 5.8]|uniref:GNAT family N-acetyltransferase n=1 Tax=Streptomyces sp. 5.8 TaxID=3406571 RepID=UPI003BB7E3A8
MIIDDGIVFRQAEEKDAGTLVALYDQAAHWMAAHGIDQWKPGQKDPSHFRSVMREGEVWIASDGNGHAVGAYELWWSDEDAWGIQPPVAGYVHRLMVEREAAPAGAGRRLLEHFERRIAKAGRERARLNCVSTNPRLVAYYQSAGYRVVGEFPHKVGKDGQVYGVILLEKRLDQLTLVNSA